MNVLFTTGTAVLVLLLAEALTREQAARVSGFLYAVFPAPVMLTSVLTSQHQETFFFLLALWFLLVYRKKKPYLSCILAGFSMLMSQLFRPEAILLIVTIAACAVFWIGREPVKRNWICMAKGLGLLFGVYAALYFTVSSGIKMSGLNDEGLVNRMPESKFLMGTDVESGGFYTDAYGYLNDITDREERKAVFQSELKDNILQGGFPFFCQKMKNFWCSYEDPNWSMGYLLKDGSFLDFAVFLLQFERGIFCMLWGLFAYHTFYTVKKAEEVPLDIFFLYLLICANTAVYLVTEIQPRYRYLIMPVIAVLCTYQIAVPDRPRKKRR